MSTTTTCTRIMIAALEALAAAYEAAEGDMPDDVTELLPELHEDETLPAVARSIAAHLRGETMELAMVLEGTPTDGFEVAGPFLLDEAYSYSNRGESAFVAPLIAPDLND